MILWLALFLLVVGISLLLAFRSMKDYQEVPQSQKVEYGLFLIRQPQEFNASFLDALKELMFKDKLIISAERLFKGTQAALTIFGPKSLLNQFAQKLNLLELEDYTSNLNSEETSVWELGVKGAQKFEDIQIENIFQDLPNMEPDDQFYWQVVLEAVKTKGSLSFDSQIRAALFVKDPIRRKSLLTLFQGLKMGGLIKVPKPFGTQQMLNFFKSRTLSKDSHSPLLDSIGVISLLKVS